MVMKLFTNKGASGTSAHKYQKKPQGRRRVALGLGVALAAVLSGSHSYRSAKQLWRST